MGGSEVLVAAVMKAMRAEGAEVMCWCHPDAAIRRIIADQGGDGIVFHSWPLDGDGSVSAREEPQRSAKRTNRVAWMWRSWAPAGLRKMAGFWREARNFSREIARVRPDLIFINVNGYEAAALAARRLMKGRVIGCYHLSVTPSSGNPLDRLADWSLRTVSMWCQTVVIHTSHHVRNQWNNLCLFPRRKTRVIYNGVEPEPIAMTDDVRAELGLGEDDFVFCVPGRLHPIKGHQYLLEALAGQPEIFARARVLVCGDGSLGEDLKRQSVAAGLDGIVRFLGWRSDLRAILRASDCAVLPSVASENASVAILEALMEGTPAIVTAVGGMAEVVKDQITGLVVPPASAKALREAMRRMLADRAWVRELGKQAQTDALARFDRNRMLNEYVEVFQTLCHRRVRKGMAERPLVSG